MVDFGRLNAAALPVLPGLLDKWLPGGQREADEYVVRNPRRADQTPGSFKINVRTGAWADFATGDRGSDPISLVAFLRHDGNQGEAARALAAELSIDEPKAKGGERIGCTVAQYAAAKRLPPSFLQSLGLADARYGGAPAVAIPYRDHAGTETARRYRTALNKGDPDRRFRWRKGAKLSLYGLWRLPLSPSPYVVLVEGESDCHTLWAHHIAAVGIPGAGAWDEQRDAGHLEGYETAYVVIEPDEAGETLKATLGRSAIRQRLKFVSLAPFKDVSALYLDNTDAFLRRWEEAMAGAVLWTDAETGAEQQGGGPAVMPYGFHFDRRGLWLRSTDREKPDVHVAGPFEVLAETRDVDGRSWGILLAWQDHDGALHELALPRAALAGDGVEARRQLMDGGLYVAPGRVAREALIAFLTQVRIGARARAVARIGWHGSTFVLPDRTIGPAEGERVLLQTEVPIKHAFRCSGTLADWQREVAAPARGNSRLILATCTALTPPFLQPLGAESGGFHLRGISSLDKTTALQVGASVWGGGGDPKYVRPWRATVNGLEGAAALHCDALLVLDELGQADARAVGDAVYMLANGSGKARAGRDGTSRALQQWRVLFLSSGEAGIAEKIAEDTRRRATAGQHVRVLDLPADADVGLGLFEVLHGAPGPAAFADLLLQAAKKYYGTAARAFLEKLTADVDGMRQAVRGFQADFLRTHCPVGVTGQVCRAADRFALVAAAGELAILLGILPWGPGEAEAGVATCFCAWLEARGGVEPAEINDGIAQVRLFIEQHGESRFSVWHDPERLTINRAGFRRLAEGGGQEFFVFPGVWRQEICRGFDAGAIARALAQRGLLVAEPKSGKLAANHHLPGCGSKTTRCYHLTSKVLEGDDDD